MIDIISPLIKKFMPYAQEKMGFADPPRLFLKGDTQNATNPLGKTAFYDPAERAVTLYTTGRHPKDVMRSLSHELVHHTQNCRGDFEDIGEMGEGYAQNDEHLREMEREAYEVGNMCFRDWEDSIKETIYFEHLQKGEKKMSIKDWKNKEITQLLSEAWGFKFNTLQEFDEFNEGADKNTGMSGVDGDDKDDTYMGHFKEEELQETGAKDTGASKGDKGKDKDDPEAKDYTDGGDRKGDESRTHKGEKDYTTKKGDKLKTSGKGRGEKKGDKAYVNEGDTGASKGDDSKTHPGEKDYTWKKGEDSKTDKGTHDDGSRKGDKSDTGRGKDYVNEDSGEEEGHHYDDDRMSDDDHIKAIEHHLDALRHDRDYDDDHIDEGGAANRAGNEEKDNGRDRMHADRVHEQSDSLREAIRAVLAKHLKG